jgi:hypothetical protein
MTPDEAMRFFETDEDPARIFAAFDAAQKGVTSPSREQALAGRTSIYAVARGLYAGLRQKVLPEVSSAGHRTYISGRA